jgi:predicted enzyme related to lactoylglutathione lyase
MDSVTFLGGYTMATQFITAVILTSQNPERLANFYRDVLEVPIEVEDHGGMKHYGCELGELHFAIHPAPENTMIGTGAVAFGLQVFDLDAFLEKLAKAGVRPLFPPGERGFAKMSAIHDLDGNMIYLTQMTDKWLQWIGERRSKKEFDIIQQWKTAGL